MALKYIILAAGGTGGHLFPAYALSEELLRRGYVVDLITDMRGDRYGSDFPAREIYKVPSATISGKSPFKLLITIFKLFSGTLKAISILRRIRPNAVVGFGGYPTLPPLVAAKICSVPAAIHEQNAVMGRANRLMLRLVKSIATSFAKTKYIEEKHYKKIEVTGNPVRQVVLDWSKQEYESPTSDGPFHLLVFGGSQGARFFSDTVPEAVLKLPQKIQKRLKIVQQCREEDLERVKEVYEKANIEVELAPFFKDLPEIMAYSHLVIGRSGASSIAELAILGRPSLLVPLPHALDNDQLQNANRLMEAGGAWCIAQKELTPERMAKELEQIIEEPQKLTKAAKAAKEAGKPMAVSHLADLVEKLVNSKIN